MKEDLWQKCPKCDGQGTVSKPHNISGDQTTWISNELSYECNVCDGAMIISILTGLPPNKTKK